MTLPLGIVASGYNVPLPVVTGGTLTSDATYYYRTFTANGTFSTTSNLTCDVWIVSGGGGGGRGRSYNNEWGNGGGGGGGGWSRELTGQVVNGNVSVVVGAGGAGYNTSTFTDAVQGSASSFGATSATPDFNQAGQNSLSSDGGNGGNSVYTNNAGTATTIAASTANSFSNPSQAWMGRGGAGNSAANSPVQNGGAGRSIFGTTIAGGGGGGCASRVGWQDVAGTGTNGGGNGGTNATGGNGTANTGGGGGGGGTTTYGTAGQVIAFGGGTGGSGRVVVRYLRSAVGG